MAKVILFLLFAQSLLAQTYPVIGFGDFGLDGPKELAVKNLVYQLSPKDAKGQPLSHIITYGDNNYEYGSEVTIDPNIGKYYSQWIKPYKGNFKWYYNGRPYSGSQDSNRFHRCLGNHDGYNYSLAADWDYFNYTPRYYKFSYGNVDFFVINSAYGNFTTLGRFNFEPDGIDSNSVQAQWLKREVQRSTAKFQIVIMHHPPWSSVQAGYEDTYWVLRWNYKLWGVDAILCGHNHLYEFLIETDGNNAGLPVFVVGTGGGEEAPVTVVRRPGSQYFLDVTYGAQFITPYNDSVNFKYIDINYVVKHSWTLRASGSPPPPTEITPLDSLKRKVDDIDRRVRILEGR